MFGAKPTGFGATFGNSGTFGGTSTPFGGSNTFGGNKPAASTGFGTPGGFGASSQPSTGLFGGAGTNNPSGGLFSGTSTPGFGQQQSSGFSFGSTPSTSSNLFGQSTPSAGGANLFGTPTSANAFGAKPTGFGGFGATTTASTAGGLFGTTQSGGGMFGTGAGGFGQSQTGTVIKFNPPSGQDTMVKNGTTQNINTKHQCITAMKEYENKSLEELRVEDYAANRKGKQGGGATQTFFGSTPATQASTGFTFGAAAAKPTGFGSSTGFGTSTSSSAGGLFGQTTSSTGSLFGQNKPLFGTATTQSGFGGFNAGANTGTSSFFNTQQNKTPFGATATSTQPSLFGNTQSTFGTSAPNTGFGGFGTSTQPSGGLFAKPFGTATTTASSGFNFGASNPSQSSLFAKPFSNTSTGFSGFNTATTSTGFGGQTNSLFGTNKPNNFSLTTSTAPSTFNFGAGLGTQQPSLFGNNQAKPGFGNLGTTTGFNQGFGGTQPLGALGGNVNTLSTNTGGSNSVSNSAQLQQTLLALSYSPYGDSPLFWNMKEATTKRDDLLKPTNPAAQKAVLASANQHKVSPRPTARIKPKSLHGVLNGSKSQMFEGLDDEDYSFGNDTFVARKSVKKLTIKKAGNDSGTPSRASSLSGEPANLQSFREEEDAARQPDRSSPAQSQDVRQTSSVQTPETENIIRSKGIADNMPDTPNRGAETMDDTIAMLNTGNKQPTHQSEQLANVSIISHDDSATDNDTMEERPTTPPPPHPAGIVLTRPGYYTMPSLEELAEMVDENGDCYVEDLTIGREGYGSIYFPGVTNIAGMNLDETVFFRRKEVIVYPDDESKPELGEGLNKKAEITLDCVWPRDKTTGHQIKDPEQLALVHWQDKIESNTSKIGAKFIDYRPETGSWVFEVKHFSKYGLVDDSDEEDVSEQEKKRLRALQEQQLAVQKQKIQQQELAKQALKQGPRGAGGDGQLARFTVGTDEESDESVAVRREVPMADDLEEQEVTPDRLSEEEYPVRGGEMDVQDDQPSSHRLATSMGVDARHMQVMKASFFGDEDQIGSGLGGELFTRKSSGAGTQPGLTKLGDRSGPSLFSSALKSKFMSPVRLPNLPQSENQNESRNLFSPRLITPEPIRPTQPTYQPPVKEHMPLASGLTPQDMPRKIVGSRVTRVIPPVEESYQYRKQEMLVDAGLFMGRSFRVGWGPGFTLAHPGDPVQQQPQQRGEERQSGRLSLFAKSHAPASYWASDWKVNLEKLNVAPHLRSEDKCMLNQHREMLEIQLENSETGQDEGGPIFTPTPGVEALHEYAEKTKEEIEDIGSHPDAASLQHMGMVWDLCVALWGNMPEFKELEVDRDSYMYHQGRREALSRWLSSVSGQIIQKEVQKAKYKDQGHLQAILSLLSGRQIGPACKLALQSGDHNLALLLAQGSCNAQAREMVDRQLEEWMSLEVERFIDETRLKIYCLLSGQLVLTSRAASVNTCSGLDWKRSLALHLWFLCQPQSNLRDAIEVYKKGFERNSEFGPYTCPPLPPYLEIEAESNEYIPTEEDPQIWDTCFHLLNLYCRKSHQLEKILNPVTSTANQLDCRLSWHLSQVLQALSYHHLSDYHQASIHMNFASHLESLGLWEWAIFVALHIESPAHRQDAARAILNRHITLSSDKLESDREELLLEKLNVPPQWIHHAKALRASYEGRHHDHAWHLLKAEHWNSSHRILLRHIAPNAIISENYEDLLKFLEELAPKARSSTILDWNIGGKIFLDYISVCQKLEEIKQAEGEASLYDLDNLLPEVKMLCTKVNSLPCHNSRDRLCQAEMAKKAATLLRTILTLQSEARGDPQPPMRQLAPFISNLPMPEDYSLHELRALTRSFMLEQSA